MGEGSGQTEGIKVELHEWPSEFNLNEERKKYLDQQRPQTLQQLREVNPFTDTVHPFEWIYAADLVNHIKFGMLQVKKRLGQKDDVPLSFIEPDEKKPSGLMRYDPDTKTVNVIPSVLREWMREKFIFGHTTTDMMVGNVMVKFKREDQLELAGVEEAAHHYYVENYNLNKNPKKRNRLQPLKIDIEDPFIEHHTSDPEYRALLWKYEYCKLYFPDSLKIWVQDTIAQVKKVREENRKMI